MRVEETERADGIRNLNVAAEDLPQVLLVDVCCRKRLGGDQQGGNRQHDAAARSDTVAAWPPEHHTKRYRNEVADPSWLTAGRIRRQTSARQRIARAVCWARQWRVPLGLALTSLILIISIKTLNRPGAARMSLNQVHAGQTAVITEVHAGNHLLQRMTALGLRRGRRVSVIRRARFGGPLHLRVGMTEVMIRGADAAALQVLVDAA